MTKDERISERSADLAAKLDKINEKKGTLQKHDIEIGKAYKMLEEAFKMMGEEKEGVIRVHKEAERKLKVLQDEYEVRSVMNYGDEHDGSFGIM